MYIKILIGYTFSGGGDYKLNKDVLTHINNNIQYEQILTMRHTVKN